MKVSLFPRLNKFGLNKVLEDLHESKHIRSSSVDILTRYRDITSYAATGGSKSEKLALYIESEIRKIAQMAGFPDINSQLNKSKFDQEAAIFLSQIDSLKTGEGLRDDVWSFITAILIPDIVTWRYNDTSIERFSGGWRNTLQRLWIRGVVLDRGVNSQNRWELIYELSEDAMVQIFERTSISSNAKLALALAEGWLNNLEKIGRNRIEDVMRNVVKIVRIKNQTTDLTYLSTFALNEIIGNAFDMSISIEKINYNEGL
ncbi:Uncharacterised protein [Serratia liquefaciens]|uniref:DUF6339 family protein n=1 Tax=Serratia liquefaciens TaxID=614 RepID=UPI002177A0F0|nr:DUF6339 family protein [Serratia liquefaciens]CAI0907023.1 Uncharacterised protein [Serratia liquefaciens]CAI1767402.1 Uncharacterised protein [Serratia liquefaciens]